MSKRQTKYIFVTGGVVSSLGKGITTASLAAILELRGLDVSLLKLDPYLNVDPGTMNPFQHGEVFVTDDGAETDLDLGHYERYTSIELSQKNSRSSGQIYQRVLDKERNGDYLGATVQVIPHVTDEIKEAIRSAAHGHDLLICEVGGTIGDIESLPFIEAIRQMRVDEGDENTAFLHVSYLPHIKAAGELKTKPTQHSVKELLSHGIQPDVLLLRSEYDVPEEIKSKIALFCNVQKRCVVNCPDVETVYEVPLKLRAEGLDNILVEQLNIWSRSPDMKEWEALIHTFKNPDHTLNIAIVGKYVDLVESYKSIHEALIHAGLACKTKVNMRYIDSEKLDAASVDETLKTAHGILVPGGFGERGVEGKIRAIRYAREHKVPFFGICYGLQIALIEIARDVLGLHDANTQESAPNTKNPVVHLMETQKSVRKKGGTMRLGAYPCKIEKGTLAARIYGQSLISERHRHRFEVNNAYKAQFQAAGVVFSGVSPDNELIEIAELKGHPFFIGCQFHPEFLSKPLRAHPVFKAFIEAALAQ